MTSRLAHALDDARHARIEINRSWLARHGPAAVERLLECPEHRWRLREILSLTSDVEGRVLELGCFTGELGRRIIAQGGKDVVGICVIPEALVTARKNGTHPVLADLEECIPARDGADFDCVVIADLLQHTLDPAHILQEGYRVLKPGGRLVVTVPNFACAFNRLTVMTGRPPHFRDLADASGLFPSAFTERSLRQLCERSGFEVDRVTTDVVMLGRDGGRASRLLHSRLLCSVAPHQSRNLILAARRPPGEGTA
jgi:SAM-dependent methyltransferase